MLISKALQASKMVGICSCCRRSRHHLCTSVCMSSVYICLTTEWVQCVWYALIFFPFLTFEREKKKSQWLSIAASTFVHISVRSFCCPSSNTLTCICLSERWYVFHNCRFISVHSISVVLFRHELFFAQWLQESLYTTFKCLCVYEY